MRGLNKVFQFYRLFLSRDQGVFRRRMPTCVFFPTCSEYAEEAFIKYAPPKAFLLSLRRVARCHPWQRNHLDPLP